MAHLLRLSVLVLGVGFLGSGTEARADDERRDSASGDSMKAQVHEYYAAEVKTSYSGAIEHIRGVSEDALDKPVSFKGYVNVPLSDVLMRMVVLHGLAHIYGAYAAVFNSFDQQPAAAS